MVVAIEITGPKETCSLYEKIPYSTATYTVIGEVARGYCAARMLIKCNGLPTMKLMEGIPGTGSLRISKGNGRGIDTRGGSALLFNCACNLGDISGTVKYAGRQLTACSCSALNKHPAHMPYLWRLNNYRSVDDGSTDNGSTDDVSLRCVAFMTYKVDSNPRNRRT